MTNIPVVHLKDEKTQVLPGSAAQHFISSHPCIRIGFYFDERVLRRETRNVSYDPCWALVDTGADHVYVDQTLIEKYQCPIATGGDVIRMNNEKDLRAHRGTLFIEQEGRSIDMWVVGMDIKSSLQPFRIILGRRFLQFCQMSWNGPEQNVALRIADNPSAY